LQQGFIDDVELQQNSPCTVIYVSEMLQRVTAIDKVGNIIKFSAAFGEEPLGKTVIEIPEDSVPKVDVANSNIVVYHNGSPMPMNKQKAEHRFANMVNECTTKSPYPAEEEIAVREGRFRDLASYTSVQHEFPLIYGVGKEGLAKSATAARKASANQLKSYLMFFDQLMANYLAQLAHIKDLMAVKAKEYRTYFAQVPEDIPYLDALIRNPHPKNAQDAAQDIEFSVQRNHLGMAPNMHKEKKAHPQPTKKVYQDYLSSIVEGKEHHRIKEDATLDHLLARFSEAFVDYSVFAHGFLREEALKTSMQNKSLFLQDYVAISRDRNKGLDITEDPRGVWDSDSITGFERRIYRSLGIRNLKRRYLYETLRDNFYVEQEREHQSLELFLGENLQTKSDQIFIFKGNFPQIEALAIRQGIDAGNYAIEEKPGGHYDVLLHVDRERDKSIKLVSKQISIKHIEQARALTRQAVNFFQEFNRECEGFHLVEHILLRNDTSFLGKSDIYSFIMTMVFPAWPARFQKESFRNLVNELVMVESPAHVFVNVLWLDREEMETFERAYKEWITLKVTHAADDPTLQEAAKNLLGLVILYAGEKG
jgi:hypothetical protein